jgi:hypothetical protein
VGGAGFVIVALLRDLRRAGQVVESSRRRWSQAVGIGPDDRSLRKAVTLDFTSASSHLSDTGRPTPAGVAAALVLAGLADLAGTRRVGLGLDLVSHDVRPFRAKEGKVVGHVRCLLGQRCGAEALL